jgi:hypothetical protein
MFVIAKKIGILSAIFVFFVLPIFSLPVFAQTETPATPPGNYGLTESKGALIDRTPQQITGTVVGAVLSLLGVIFFLLVIYGGLRWMLAQGNEQEVEKAKQILIAAVIGLVIVLSAYAITTFIGTQLTSGK